MRVSYANALSNGQTVQPFYATGVAPGNALAIKYGNPYIPASVLAGLPAGVSGNTAFFLGRNNTDIGFARPTIEDKVLRAAAGLNGKFGGKWTWNAYVAYGKTTYEQNIYNNFLGVNGAGNGTDLNNHWLQATDVILNASGQAVCRNAAAVAQGCVPANVFGDGSISAAAKAYLTATQTQIQDFRQDVVAASIQGEPFDNWAGAVSVAAGAEYRKESVSSSVDAFSEANAFYLGNPKALFGSYNVREFFAETVVPLAKDKPWLKALDFNAAVRATNYSLAGSVTTWKAGLTWKLNDAVMFRGVRSRDIRAANLGELYQAGATQRVDVRDSTLASAPTVSATRVTSGNVDLKPEVADTNSLGIVLRPSFLPGFNLSLDYYSIAIKDAVTTPAAQEVIDRCARGEQILCTLIVRTNGTITQVLGIPVNVAQQKVRGYDLESSWSHETAGLGTFQVRALATRMLDFYVFNNNVKTDSLGQNTGSVPKWRWLASVGWQRNPVSLTLTGRGFAAGVYDNTYVSGISISDNHLPGSTYFDLAGDYTFSQGEGGRKLMAYFKIENLFDKDPAIVAANGISSQQSNPALYDTIGRNYRVGVRFRY